MFLNRKALVYVYSQPIDMRWGFERLSYFVREQMDKNINEGDLFLFLGKNRRRLKALTFDGSGLILITKRMEKKSFMAVEELEGRAEISKSELELILHGSVIRKYAPDPRVSA